MNMAVGGVIILFVWIFVGTYCDGCIGIIALSTCYKFRALRSRVVQGELELQWCQGTLRRVILTTLARISHGDVTNRRVY